MKKISKFYLLVVLFVIGTSLYLSGCGTTANNLGVSSDNDNTPNTFSNVKTLAVEEDPVLIGDVDHDGVVTTRDANLVAEYYVGLEVENFDVIKADVYVDGKVDIVDSLVIAKFVGNLEEKLPVLTLKFPEVGTITKTVDFSGQFKDIHYLDDFVEPDTMAGSLMINGTYTVEVSVGETINVERRVTYSVFNRPEIKFANNKKSIVNPEAKTLLTIITPSSEPIREYDLTTYDYTYENFMISGIQHVIEQSSSIEKKLALNALALNLGGYAESNRDK